jgi:ribonuclease P protein component
LTDKRLTHILNNHKIESKLIYGYHIQTKSKKEKEKTWIFEAFPDQRWQQGFTKKKAKRKEKNHSVRYNMLPKIYRLRKKKDFENVYKKGRSFKQGFLFLKFLNNNSGVSRIGIVVSKKVALRATVRNLIKRRIRAAVKELVPNIKQGQDIVISALSGVDKTTDFRNIKETLEKLLFKAEIINKN